MDLLIDVGNTKIKWAYAIDYQLKVRGSSVFKASDFSEIGELLKLKEFLPKRVFFSSVLSNNISDNLKHIILQSHSCVVYQIRTVNHFLDISVCYDQVSTFGVDRWLSLIGAYDKYRKAVMVADLGSAITIDLINSSGVHQGGLITAGVGKALGSLSSCSLLPDINCASFFKQQKVEHLSCNTSEAMINGVCLSVSSLLNYQAELQLTEHQQDLKLVLTGGDSELILPLLNHDWELSSSLLFDGLLVLSKHENLLEYFI
ncbi:type III pantothenate kinase [Thiomicrospira microaerophila]|uniref:type III pantothenate kinase n=1 Tax=Thiomicrospira microaerophila TaxID=406020 RepID=UPI00200D24FA|nr:type III pantothenate kinase [Thiomicrospira microaerophila]UQB42547.1 type III pantothenate kinase [Thiomicrospira microaerophila]